MHPLSLLLRLLFVIIIYSQPVHLVSFPAPNVFVLVWPLESSFPILLPILEVPFIPPPIIPDLCALPFHIAHSELAFVPLIQVSKIVFAIALKLAIKEVSIIKAAIFPLEPSLSILLSLIELALVPGLPIVPTFLAYSMLQVIQPLANVLGS